MMLFFLHRQPLQLSLVLLTVTSLLSSAVGGSVEITAACDAPHSGGRHGAVSMSQIRSHLKDELATVGDGSSKAAFVQNETIRKKFNAKRERNSTVVNKTSDAMNSTRTISSRSWAASNVSEPGGESEADITEQVHKQARVVARSAGRILKTTDRGNRTVDTVEENYKKAKEAAERAQGSYEKQVADLDEKRSTKEHLHDATQAAEAALWKLQKEYAAAELAYQEARKSEAAAAEAAENWEDAKNKSEQQMQSTAKRVAHETNELQDNIDKLNDLNEQLQKYQALEKNAAGRVYPWLASSFLARLAHWNF